MVRFFCKNFKVVFLQSFFLFFFFAAFSQIKVKFQITNLSGNHLPDSFFVAGNFNDWNPRANGNYFSRPGEETFIEIINLQPGDYQYKFTRGSWNKSECLAGGKVAEKQVFEVGGRYPDPGFNRCMAG